MASADTANLAVTSSTTQGDGNHENIEYNARWFGYLSIIFFSAINFACISNVDPLYETQFVNVAGAMFGVLTFIIASLVLIQDRSQKLLDYFHYTKSRNGYAEGAVLLFMVVWWIVGVGVVTKPGGIAYQASNIYYSSWGALFACLYTLDLWSTEKDILSFDEMTGVSCTLKSWWIHFLSACVTFACSINLHVRINFASYESEANTPYAIALGLGSIAVSTFWIAVHLDFFKKWSIHEGGWLELFSSFFLIFLWIVGLSVFTTDGGIAAKMEGDECKSELSTGISDSESNCTVILFLEDSEGAISKHVAYCTELPEDVPGSNLYYACWSCMLSSIAIAFKWKASQALRFAQAQAERQQQNGNVCDSFVVDEGEDDSSQ
eukprot:jgi/Psemu1/246524/estExt_Genewise1.C_8040005